MLVPELAGGAAGELAPLRAACAQAIGALLDAAPDEIVVLGAGTRTCQHTVGAAGSLRGFGVDVRTGAGDPVLPLALTLGGWLLDQAADGGSAEPAEPPLTRVTRVMVEVAADVTAEQAAALGERLAGRPGRTALLVIGDGAIGRTVKAPGAFDARAVAWDDSVAALLAAADARGLGGLDARVGGELGVSALASWRVAAAAVTSAGGLGAASGRLLAYEGRYGVGYFVATWLPG